MLHGENVCAETRSSSITRAAARRLRVPVEVRVLGFDADFGEWAQLEEGSISEIARQPGFKVKLTAKK